MDVDDPHDGADFIARYTPEDAALFALTMEHAGIGMLITDPVDGRVLAVNAAACDLLGRDETTLKARTWQSLTHPDDLDEDQGRAMELADGTRDSFHHRKRYLRPDGTLVWADLTVTIARDPDGHPLVNIAQIVDITSEVTTHAALLESEDRYRALAENASDIVIRVSIDGTLEWVSPSVTKELGWSPEELIGTTPWHLVHPADVMAAAQSLATAAEAGVELLPLTLRMLSAGGEYRWMSTRATQVGASVVVSFRMVDDEVQAQTALAESEARYRMLAENVMDMVISTDLDWTIQWASPSVQVVLGYDPEALTGANLRTFIHPDELELLEGATSDTFPGRGDAYVVRYLTASGEARWMESSPRVMRGLDGHAVGMVVAIRDVDEKVRTRQALAHEVAFDGLTGLARRNVALRRIDELLQTGEAGRTWALLCVGIDGMTAVNQAYTYSAGDLILKSVADRLVAAVGAHDRVARIAGDEFVLIMRDLASAPDAALAAERVLAAVRGPVDVGGTSIDVTACVGIALTDGANADEILRDATAAMRQAASRGTDRWGFLDGNVGVRTREELTTQAALREAIDLGRIVPWFMPLVDLADGGVVGYEALVRWVEPDGTVYLPDHFLGIAERTGTILTIDQAMLGHILAKAAEAPDGVSFGFNVSAASLAAETFADGVGAMLDDSGVDPRRLHFEVTETSLFHVTAGIQKTMSRLADRGIGWWVDDFGTGFSSISHLRELPITGLKLDKSFTDGVTFDDTRASRLALGLVGLAKGLGLHTVAEGIETNEQAVVLAGQGWEMGQGWLYGQAAPFPD